MSDNEDGQDLFGSDGGSDAEATQALTSPGKGSGAGDLFGSDSENEDAEATQVQKRIMDEDDDDETQAATQAQPSRRIVDSDDEETQAATQAYPSRKVGSDNEDETQSQTMSGLFSDEEEATQAPKPRSPSDEERETRRRDGDSDSDSGRKESGRMDDLFASDDEENISSNRRKTTADMFSSEDEAEHSRDKGKGRAAADSAEEEEGGEVSGEEPDALFGSEASEPEEEVEVVHVDLSAPKFDLIQGENPVLVRLPNFLSIETKPFDAATYDEDPVKEVLDDDGKARVRLRVENTIRWRYARDQYGEIRKDEKGEPMRESNAKMVRWDDGSMSLVLGSEVFDVKERPLGGDYNHLYVRSGNVLSGQACFNTRYTFGLSSFTSLTHKRLTESVAGKVKKQGRMQMLTLEEDPAKRLKEIQQIEDDKLRARRQLETKRQKVRNTVDYLEQGMGGYEDEYEDRGATDSEEELERERRLRKAKRGHSESEEEEEEEEDNRVQAYDDSGDDDDGVIRRTGSQKKRRVDSEDEDSE